uniref:melatonin receptor type 1A-like n=1 Tax=Styela clava TaxID=7725 RepID=UPI001939C980|nr:melatonin receptor type 1A-like [Styela clava]
MDANSTTSPQYATSVTQQFSNSSSTNSHDLGANVGKIIFLAIVAIFGTLGNILVIVTIRKEKKLRIPGNYFIINLTVSDIIITAFSIPAIIYNLSSELAGDYIDYVESTAFCQSSAYVKIIALHVSWYSLAFIALNRYYTVCRMDEYANHFKKKRVLITIILIWLWIVLINIPIMVGWAVPNNKELKENSTEGYYFSYPRSGPPVVYDQSTHDCMVGVKNHGGYTYANGFFVMCIPLLAIVFCYALVYMEIVQSRRRMKGALDAKQLKKRYKKERKISLMLAIVVIVFILCWAPAIIYDYTSTIDEWKSGESSVRLVVNWIALCNSAMNPALYALLSKAFRQGYLKVLFRILRTILCRGCVCRKLLNNKLHNYSLSSSRTFPTKSSREIIGKDRLRLRSLATSNFILSGRASIGSELPVSTLGIPETKLQTRRRQNQKGKRWKRISRAVSAEILPPQGVVESRVSVMFTPPSIDETVEGGAQNSVVAQTSKADTPKCDSSANGNSKNKMSLLQSISINVSVDNGLNGDEKPVSPTKKKFVPLLEQLEKDSDMFTEQGIYIGETSPKRKFPSVSKENSQIKQNKGSIDES